MSSNSNNRKLLGRDLQQVRIEYVILRVIKGSAEPIGASVLLAHLESQFAISEPTIGRKLRELDRAGHTTKIGKRGRIISPKGLDYLQELEELFMKVDHAESLLALLGSERNRELLIEVLEARKVLETEIVRRAAVRIRDDQLTVLKRLLSEQSDATATEEAGAQQSIEFHDLIAEASGNRVLRHALALTRLESNLSPHVARIRKEVGGNLVGDHDAIYTALSQHDPDAAEAAMRTHIDGLIRDVERYWRRTSASRDVKESKSEPRNEKQS
ncbi:MAG: FCD domain-containing protein [Bacillota bacterium]|nr:MAG: FCD domain-containing protein [Bacillota bacterium]